MYSDMTPPHMFTIDYCEPDCRLCNPIQLHDTVIRVSEMGRYRDILAADSMPNSDLAIMVGTVTQPSAEMLVVIHDVPESPPEAREVTAVRWGWAVSATAKVWEFTDDLIAI